ncbi:sensor histidine kinase [Acidisphaera sp. S103]|uniref:sensor histidine kinase n=1 Tax=Acidisphaera sp. S103 TaxID=1747223 RepID=UPI001C209195|nr:sensor histidine kinase [Acidisphaera sp. S103]
MTGDFANRVTEHYANCAGSGDALHYEEVLPVPREIRRLKSTLASVRQPDTGRIHRSIGRTHNVTERHPPAMGVVNVPGTLQSILNALAAQVLVLDSNGAVFAMNAAWQANATPTLPIGTNYLAACDAGNAGNPVSDETANGLRELFRGARDEFRIDYPLGQCWFQLRATMLDISDGRFLMLVCEDVTKVRRCSEVLRQLPRKLIRIRDEERRKISRELHDSTAQNLVGASLATERAMRLGTKLPRKAAEALRDALGLIQLSLREIRTLSYLLHPPLLDDAGLAHALGWYVDCVARRGDVMLDLKIGHDISRRLFPREVEMALFRVAQEAIGNAHRHAGGSRIDVDLQLMPGECGEEIVLTVVDNGVGPSCAVMRAVASSTCNQRALGVGLAGLRERLDELGGRLTVQPGQNGGTLLRAVVPLTPAAMTAGSMTPQSPVRRPIITTAEQFMRS